MTRPVRSIRLEKRSSRSLDTLSGSSGEIFYDSDNNCLRIYTANQGARLLLADRTWTTDAIGTAIAAIPSVDLGPYATTVAVDAAIAAIPSVSLDGYATTLYVDDAIAGADLGGGGLADLSSSSIGDLLDVDLDANPPATGNVLKWDGSKWAPGLDVASGGIGLNADSLDGFDGSYYLNYSNFTNTPTIPADVGDLTDTGGIIGASDFSGAYADLTGIPTFATVATSGSYSDLTGTPTSITSFGITDGTSGQVLTTNGSGGFSFTTVESAGGGGLVVVADDLNPALGGTLQANGNNIDMGTNIISDPKVGTWDQAYAWGDHSLAGYLASETFTGTMSNLIEDTTPQLGGTLDANGNTIDMGTNIITDAAVGQFITAFGWGDHSTAGYAAVSAGELNLGSNDLRATDIAATGNVQVTGDVSAATFTQAGVGAPSITSASTFNIDAPDGTILTSGVLRFASFTTTERNALGAVAGDVIFNTTDTKLQVYTGATWVNLH